MTEEEYKEKAFNILSKVPEKYHSNVSYKAYEGGHSGGYEEILNVLYSLVEIFE